MEVGEGGGGEVSERVLAGVKVSCVYYLFLTPNIPLR